MILEDELIYDFRFTKYELLSVQCSAVSDQIAYISLYDLYGLGKYDIRYAKYDLKM